jgi:hypothetical protein
LYDSRHDITEILLKVALNTIKQTNKQTNKQTIEQMIIAYLQNYDMRKLKKLTGRKRLNYENELNKIAFFFK